LEKNENIGGWVDEKNDFSNSNSFRFGKY
jgi:hypothetical protein